MQDKLSVSVTVSARKRSTFFGTGYEARGVRIFLFRIPGCDLSVSLNVLRVFCKGNRRLQQQKRKQANTSPHILAARF